MSKESKTTEKEDSESDAPLKESKPTLEDRRGPKPKKTTVSLWDDKWLEREEQQSKDNQEVNND